LDDQIYLFARCLVESGAAKEGSSRVSRFNPTDLMIAGSGQLNDKFQKFSNYCKESGLRDSGTDVIKNKDKQDVLDEFAAQIIDPSTSGNDVDTDPNPIMLADIDGSEIYASAGEADGYSDSQWDRSESSLSQDEE
jgi:hypothetical protein